MGRQNPFKRAETSRRPLHLTQTAQAALAAIAQFGPVTGEQLRQLVWPRPSQKSHGEAVLRRLFDAAYVERIPLVDDAGPARIVYVLGPTGRRAEAQRLNAPTSILGPRPAKQRSYKPLFLHHHLATVQLVINLQLAAARSKGALISYTSDRALRRERAKGNATLPVVPDAIVRLQIDGQAQSFLVELDRATKTASSWRNRLEEYWGFQATRVFDRDYQSPALLIAVDAVSSLAAARLRSLKGLIDASSQGRDATLFWLTTLADATPAAVLTKPIWQVGGREGRYSLLPPGRRGGAAA